MAQESEYWNPGNKITSSRCPLSFDRPPANIPLSKIAPFDLPRDAAKALGYGGYSGLRDVRHACLVCGFGRLEHVGFFQWRRTVKIGPDRSGALRQVPISVRSECGFVVPGALS
jgi:hypothetical protein